MNASYRALMRELRETRTRLARIEKLQTEIEQMRRLLAERAPSTAGADARTWPAGPQQAGAGQPHEDEPVSG